jgi:hypothetical protein
VRTIRRWCEEAPVPRMRDYGRDAEIFKEHAGTGLL